jgi:NTE family protein
VKLDLVLDGGGVRGIALVGALAALEGAGYEPARVAGTSAGAVVGALVAAGVRGPALQAAMEELDYRRFEDKSRAHRVPFLGKSLSLLVAKGVYHGRYLSSWLGQLLSDQGVRTFGDLRIDDDPATSLAPGRRYRLVVTTVDVSRGTLLRLPWDYHRYGLDPDDQLVVDAVRASASVPFFFEPVPLQDASGNTSLLMDGGVVADFPVDIFDRTDGRPARWPTVGLKLSGGQRPEEHRPIGGPLGLGLALLSTMRNVYEQRNLGEEGLAGRTMFLDTSRAVARADFGIDRAAQAALYEEGRRQAAAFLAAGRLGPARARAPLSLVQDNLGA